MSGFSCADLVPIDMKWACTCAGRRDVVHTHHDEKKGTILMNKGRIFDRKKGPVDQEKKAKQCQENVIFWLLFVIKRPLFLFDRKSRFGVLIEKKR